ncbi:hypothetical protein B0J11DRAFT_542215 [Dendryphion nanum]|uniref:Uncharacterized protein n=1 Tax=Dendryphion nanum TaxID=256645 RepID=A0A9P9D5P5_9PLEO|nr:hypothetical protein B0J11DRAFT_542215 [Dendryphion nanum]
MNHTYATANSHIDMENPQRTEHQWQTEANEFRPPRHDTLIFEKTDWNLPFVNHQGTSNGTKPTIKPKYDKAVFEHISRAFHQIPHAMMGEAALSEYGKDRVSDLVEVMIPAPWLQHTCTQLTRNGMKAQTDNQRNYRFWDKYAVQLTTDADMGTSFNRMSFEGQPNKLTPECLLDSLAYSSYVISHRTPQELQPARAGQHVHQPQRQTPESNKIKENDEGILFILENMEETLKKRSTQPNPPKSFPNRRHCSWFLDPIIREDFMRRNKHSRRIPQLLKNLHLEAEEKSTQENQEILHRLWRSQETENSNKQITSRQQEQTRLDHAKNHEAQDTSNPWKTQQHEQTQSEQSKTHNEQSASTSNNPWYQYDQSKTDNPTAAQQNPSMYYPHTGSRQHEMAATRIPQAQPQQHTSTLTSNNTNSNPWNPHTELAQSKPNTLRTQQYATPASGTSTATQWQPGPDGVVATPDPQLKGHAQYKYDPLDARNAPQQNMQANANTTSWQN